MSINGLSRIVDWTDYIWSNAALLRLLLLLLLLRLLLAAATAARGSYRGHPLVFVQPMA